MVDTAWDTSKSDNSQNKIDVLLNSWKKTNETIHICNLSVEDCNNNLVEVVSIYILIARLQVCSCSYLTHRSRGIDHFPISTRAGIDVALVVKTHRRAEPMIYVNIGICFQRGSSLIPWSGRLGWGDVNPIPRSVWHRLRHQWQGHTSPWHIPTPSCGD